MKCAVCQDRLCIHDAPKPVGDELGEARLRPRPVMGERYVKVDYDCYLSSVGMCERPDGSGPIGYIHISRHREGMANEPLATAPMDASLARHYAEVFLEIAAILEGQYKAPQ